MILFQKLIGKTDLADIIGLSGHLRVHLLIHSDCKRAARHMDIHAGIRKIQKRRDACRRAAAAAGHLTPAGGGRLAPLS